MRIHISRFLNANMFLSSYRLLPRGDNYHDHDKRPGGYPEKGTSLSNLSWKAICTILSISLVASVLTTASLLNDRHQCIQPHNNDTPSKYAGLRYDMLKKIDPESRYFSLNRTRQDAAWEEERLNSWTFYVALDEDYTISQGLPHAMRWPWNQQKGVYLLAAGHQLHCIQALRSWMNDKEDGKQEADMDYDYSHALHCLNSLREAVMCNADDMPLYTGRLHDNIHYKKLLAGRGMTRMCRNWDALRDWADKRSACYMPVGRKNDSFSEIDRYKYCPDDSRPWEEHINSFLT